MHKSVVWMIGGAILLVMAAGGVFLVGGGYNVAADEPHWSVTAAILEAARDRSITRRASSIAVPDLADPELVALGAEHYASMCAGCHLAPGAGDSELRAGLYPRPPNLAAGTDSTAGHQHPARSPAEQFWIIKHGVKMSGMPAWGATHDDTSIWGMVAFLRQLPTLDPVSYAALTGVATEAGHGGHAHGDGEASHVDDHHATGDSGTEHATGDSGTEEAHEHVGHAGH